MPVPISSSKSQGLLTGLPEPPFVQAHYSIRIEPDINTNFILNYICYKMIVNENDFNNYLKTNPLKLRTRIQTESGITSMFEPDERVNG